MLEDLIPTDFALTAIMVGLIIITVIEMIGGMEMIHEIFNKMAKNRTK